MKTLICPDLHGRDTYKPLLTTTNEKIICLGDYEDPYPHENISYEDMISRMMDLFSFADDNKDRVVMLLGNHSYPYFRQRRGYSRYDWRNAKQIEEIYNEFRHLFKVAYWDEETQTMFTHAGITSDWWKAFELPIDWTPKQIEMYLNNLLHQPDESIPWDPLEEIGRARGGYSKWGSCIWAHVTEHCDTEQMPWKQCFGHSQLDKTGSFIHQNNWWMCDSRAIFEYDGNELKLYTNDNSE